MGETAQNQTALDELPVDNQKLRGELEQALEDRERAKAAAKEPKEKVKTMNAVVKDKLGEIGAEDGQVFRIGRFRVTFKRIEGKAVSFDTEDRTQTYIKVDKGEA